MKYLKLLIFTIGTINSFGQNEFQGTVLNPYNNAPVPFANISFVNQVEVVSDIEGRFRLTIIADSSIDLKVRAAGYTTKTFSVSRNEKILTFKLIPIPAISDEFFIFFGKARDTSFFENGKLRSITYLGNDIEEFYQSGRPKFKSANGSTRNWYENGKLKNQSILLTNRVRQETTWYENGQMESEGTVYWVQNDKENEGEWFKDDDWKYWTKKGKEKNNR
jgi:hypothetical protein